MDSMRHLSRSLPSASSRLSEPPADLLADFKAAALSVTTLYKTAATAQTKIRAAGYQDALDDLLAFLDKENLGLMDGEGWRVRQWATERLDSDGSTPKQGLSAGNNTDDEEEILQPPSMAKDDDNVKERSSSPDVQKRPAGLPVSSSELDEEEPSHRRVVSEPLLIEALPTSARPQTSPPSSTAFTFQSTHPYPTNHDREGMDLDTTSAPANAADAPIRILPRPNRARHNQRRNDARASALNINLGSGAGNKRKMPYSDFFDISGLQEGAGSDRKDSGGVGRGGKRGRFV